MYMNRKQLSVHKKNIEINMSLQWSVLFACTTLENNIYDDNIYNYQGYLKASYLPLFMILAE